MSFKHKFFEAILVKDDEEIPESEEIDNEVLEDDIPFDKDIDEQEAESTKNDFINSEESRDRKNAENTLLFQGTKGEH